VAIETWAIEGSYFEACNCEVICPCRSVGDRPGGWSSYGHCDFALSWSIRRGYADQVDLASRQVVMAGRYRDDPAQAPADELLVWEVALYIDDGAATDQHEALAQIFLGHAGGQTLRNYAAAIGTVHEVRSASIDLDHQPGKQRITADDAVTVRALAPAATPGPVTCAIPGPEHPGTELYVEEMAVDAPGLRWAVRGRCGFATDFAYAGP
jgi:hypothetical protein